MTLFVTGIADGELEEGALTKAVVVLSVDNFWFLKLLLSGKSVCVCVCGCVCVCVHPRGHEKLVP